MSIVLKWENFNRYPYTSELLESLYFSILLIFYLLKSHLYQKKKKPHQTIFYNLMTLFWSSLSSLVPEYNYRYSYSHLHLIFYSVPETQFYSPLIAQKILTLSKSFSDFTSPCLYTYTLQQRGSCLYTVVICYCVACLYFHFVSPNIL